MGRLGAHQSQLLREGAENITVPDRNPEVVRCLGYTGLRWGEVGAEGGNPPGIEDPAAPSSFAPNGSGASPSVATARYDPATGRYVTSDGQLIRQADLAPSSKPRTWKDMLITAG
jgi:hypothetical protein